MQETVFEEIVVKDLARADRMLRSESARRRRKTGKQIRETKIVNQWAKSRRQRKRK
jgi:hypothetical protein